MFMKKKFSHQCVPCSSEASPLKWHLTGYTTALLCLSIISLLFLSACFSFLGALALDILSKGIMLISFPKFRSQIRNGIKDFLSEIRSKGGPMQ